VKRYLVEIHKGAGPRSRSFEKLQSAIDWGATKAFLRGEGQFYIFDLVSRTESKYRVELSATKVSG
jgi:hypothetical protein